MRTALVIPARYESSRFPGKPLTIINGPDGPKTLIERTWDIARRVARRVAHKVDVTVVATNSVAIANHVRDFGGNALLSHTPCANGTERCADAANILGLTDHDYVVNLQGDALLTPPSYIESLIADHGNHEVATVVQPAPDNLSPGDVTAVVNSLQDALYFSRAPIPAKHASSGSPRRLQHVGLYSYRVGALRRYAALRPSEAEESEGLEQLRFLEYGIPVKCLTSLTPHRLVEVNSPPDVQLVQEILNANR